MAAPAIAAIDVRMRASTSSGSLADAYLTPRDKPESAGIFEVLPTRTPSPLPFGGSDKGAKPLAERTDDVYSRLKRLESDVLENRPFPVIVVNATFITDPEGKCLANLIIASVAFARGLKTEGFEAISRAYDLLKVWDEHNKAILAEIKDDREYAAAHGEYTEKIMSFKGKLDALCELHTKEF